ncbi:MAG: response regulator [Bacteroidales bacterium]|nr:response regulator [Bacteroidales bacterium]
MIDNLGIFLIILIVIIAILGFTVLFLQQKVKKYKIHGEATIKELNLSKSEFWSSISHNIRTPMNGIVGLIDLLKKTNISKEQSEYMEDLVISSNNLLTVVNNLLDRSRLASDDIELDEVPFNIHDVIYGIADLVSNDISKKQLELAIYVEPKIPQTLLGDPVRIKEILLNMINNAIRYTETGQIVIFVERIENTIDKVEVKFKVDDTGIGMNIAKQKALYNTITRMDRLRFLDSDEPGITLAVSKKICELMGGEMGFNSEEGNGTSFWFTAQLTKTTTRLDITKAVLDISFSGLSVVVIEPNEISRKILIKYLQSLSITAKDFPDPSAAYSYFKERGAESTFYDLVLLDREYRDTLDTFVIKKLRDITQLSKAELILISTTASLFPLKSLKEVGYSGYLNKPIKLAHLANEIGSIIPAKYKDLRKPDIGESPKNLKILLVEDNLINEKIAKTSLNRLGYNVDVSRTGKDAISKYRREEYDLVLMDLKMPELDGFQVCEAMRDIDLELEKPNAPKILALTAEDYQGIREKCRVAGMDGMLRKPFNYNELSNILDL